MNDNTAQRSRASSSTVLLDGTSEGGRERLAFFLGTDPSSRNALRLLPYIGSAAAVAVTLACGVLTERFMGLQCVLLVFLLAILASAILSGLLPSRFTCVLSVLAFNFFRIPPIYIFTIADPDNTVALFVFFIVAVIISNLTAAIRSQIAIARTRAKTAELYAFGRKVAGIDDLLWATACQISSMLKLHTVLNAAKHPPPGGRVDIRARRDGETATVEVIDEGPGIPPADLERIFDKFYRVQALDRRRAGTGLGLAICRGFIEAQGGHIEANNRRNRTGAVLRVHIPVPEAAAICEPAAAHG